MSAGRGKVALHTVADALDVLGKTEIVEAIAFDWFSRAGCLSLRCKAFDNVELLLDSAELILLMTRCGIAVAIDDSQREQ
ncbi:hypothetical protein D9M69_672620 [compost metagenome]